MASSGAYAAWISQALPLGLRNELKEIGGITSIVWPLSFTVACPVRSKVSVEIALYIFSASASLQRKDWVRMVKHCSLLEASSVRTVLRYILMRVAAICPTGRPKADAVGCDAKIGVTGFLVLSIMSVTVGWVKGCGRVVDAVGTLLFGRMLLFALMVVIAGSSCVVW